MYPSVGRNRTGEAVAFHHPNLPQRVEVIDCTLRDGEQAPGVWFTMDEKIALARLLDEAGVDLLDAGFPASCPEEVETLQTLRDLGLNVRIGATARVMRADVLAAERARAQDVFLFLPTSDIQLISGLGVTQDQAATRLRAQAEEVVARGMTLNLVAEDAYRSDPAWLIRLYESLCPIPVERFVLCDTVGAAHPAGMERLISVIYRALGDEVKLCTHCHNDFGLASANSLAAVMAGARAVTCTVNALGERAGNADMAEIVAALTHLLGVEHGVTPLLLPVLAGVVDRLSGMHSSPLKAVTGFNVYSHESGVHVKAMLKDSRSYEHLPSAWTGQKTRYVVGKSSGISLVHHLADSVGVKMTDEDANALLSELKIQLLRRPKQEHDRMDLAIRAFRERELGGISTNEVCNEIVTRSTRPPPSRRSGTQLRAMDPRPAPPPRQGLTVENDRECVPSERGK